MDVEKGAAQSAQNAAQSRALAAKKHELELEREKLEIERGKARQAAKDLVADEVEKNNQVLVQISNEAENQISTVKKLNSERVRAVNENTQKHYDDLAAKTAVELKQMDQRAANLINDRKSSTMDRIKTFTDKGEDPFYRVRTLAPTLGENDKEYQVKVNLPAHEAQNLMVSGEGPYLKLSLARRFQDDVKNSSEGVNTRTSSYQSVVEQIALPGAYDARGIRREYADGVVTVIVPKVIHQLPPAPELA